MFRKFKNNNERVSAFQFDPIAFFYTRPLLPRKLSSASKRSGLVSTASAPLSMKSLQSASDVSPVQPTINDLKPNSLNFFVAVPPSITGLQIRRQEREEGNVSESEEHAREGDYEESFNAHVVVD